MDGWPYQGISCSLGRNLFNPPPLGLPTKQSRCGTCRLVQQFQRSKKAAKYGASHGLQSRPLLALRVHSLVVDRMDMYGGGDPLVPVDSVGGIARHVFGPVVLLKSALSKLPLIPSLLNE